MKESTKKPVVIRISDQEGNNKTENLLVYAFDQEGKLVETANFKQQTAVLKSPKRQVSSNLNLYIAGRIEQQKDQFSIKEKQLIKAGAYLIVKRFTPEYEILIDRLPLNIYEFLPFNFCRITGRLRKNFIVDGVNKNLAVCNARVHICEVDPIYIFRPDIPDLVIFDIRDRFKDILDKYRILPNFPFPRPIPGPFPRPIPGSIGPFPKSRVRLANLSMSAGMQANMGESMEKIPVMRDNKFNFQPQISESLLEQLSSTDVNQVRDTLFLNHRILAPYFCWWPRFWPYLYIKEEIAVVYSDCNGVFETWYPCFQNADQPDVYIWVEVCINGVWTTVYRPSVPCNTRWNYVCGSEIPVQLYDPRIPLCSCDVIEGNIVWIKRVGNGTSIRNIAMKPNSPSTPSLFADCRGLTNSTGVEVGSFVSPFSDGFPIVVQFGDGFPSSVATHFRWKFKRIEDANLRSVTEDYEYQQGTLNKSYTFVKLNSSGTAVFYSDNYQLDETLPSGKIYKIPHVEASVATGIPSAEWDQDTTTISFVGANGVPDSPQNLDDGLYEFVLELCDSSGNVQTVNNNVFQVDSLKPSPPNEASTPAFDVDPQHIVSGIGGATGFRFLIRIDNIRTSCEIFDAVVSNGDGTGATTDTICGFAEYKSKTSGNVLFRFNAEQPRNFANYSFQVTKGNTTPGAAFSIGGQVPEPANNQVVNGANTSFQGNPTIGDLLGSCAEAAFAENLYVSAYHTNGSNRLSGFDSSDVVAIALKPVSEE